MPEHKDESMAREYIRCVAVAAINDERQQGYNDPNPLSPAKLKGACMSAAIMTGIPAKTIEDEAREWARNIWTTGQDWRRQLDLLKTYEKEFGYV